MTMRIVPDFFQDTGPAALRLRAQWLEETLGLDAAFLAKLLNEEPAMINAWRNRGTSLPPVSEETFQELWDAVLHLLSHYNFDAKSVQQLLNAPVHQHTASTLLPPWAGLTLRTYLESQGPAAIREVDRWVLSFRFGDPYAPVYSTVP